MNPNSHSRRWKVDATRVLTKREIAAVLDAARRRRRYRNTRQNLVVFRLATCCGLRASEIAGLRIDDVRVSVERPHLYVRKEVAKGRRPRRVPLWWDRGTLADLTAWREERLADGAERGDYFVCTQAKGRSGRRLDRRKIRLRFRQACKVLGEERLLSLTVHDGRHAFVSHALAGGRTLAEVRDAAGHASVATTSIYTHLAVEDDGAVGDRYGAG